MANRYWVGGTANWDGTAGTKWATTSGGGGGASVPTSADDVFFTNLSTGTCTIAAGNTGAKSINCTGFTGTIAGSAAITVSGSVTLVAGMTYTHTGTITFNANATITTAGKTFSLVTVNGSGITVQLADALTIGGTGALTVTQGTFTTNNFNVSGSAINSNNSNTRTINLGSSTVSLSGTSVPWSFDSTTNLTFNAGTSQINLSGVDASLNVAATGLTFYNVSITTASIRNPNINGANTFNNLSLAGRSSVGIANVSISADQTINGTLTLSAGSNSTCRTFVRSNGIGTNRTLTCNAVASLTDIDFRDITIAGSAAPVSGTRLGDCKGNSGITFPAAKTVYWVDAGSSSWSQLRWSQTAGGTPLITDFPLAQDTAIFPSNFPNSGQTITINATYNIGTIDMSARTTNTMTLATGSQTPFIYGNWINGTGTTLTGTANITFSGRGSQTITSAGRTFTQPINIESPSGTVQLGDAYNASNTITLTQGTFSAVTYNVTCTRFISTSSLTRTLNMGSGLWTLTGTGTGLSSPWELGLTVTNLTLNKDSADILFSDTSATARQFRGADQSYNKLTIGGATGTSTLTINGANTFTELASTKTVAHTISFATTGFTINTWSVTGSVGNVVTVNSTTTGARRTFTLTNVTSGIDYLAVQDIGVTDANRFYVGANSTDGGNNSNVIFTAAPAPAASNSNFFLMFA
jgi:hypothetical protein